MPLSHRSEEDFDNITENIGQSINNNQEPPDYWRRCFTYECRTKFQASVIESDLDLDVWAEMVAMQPLWTDEQWAYWFHFFYEKYIPTRIGQYKPAINWSTLWSSMPSPSVWEYYNQSQLPE